MYCKGVYGKVESISFEKGVAIFNPTLYQCCHCCFFTRSGIFCFVWCSAVFIENLFFYSYVVLV